MSHLEEMFLGKKCGSGRNPSRLTGIAALIAAFYLSLPDRSKLWLMLPVLPLSFWLLGSGYGCYLHLVEFGSNGWSLAKPSECLRFIVGISLPASIALFFSLRRSTPLDPTAPLSLVDLELPALPQRRCSFSTHSMLRFWTWAHIS